MYAPGRRGCRPVGAQRIAGGTNIKTNMGAARGCGAYADDNVGASSATGDSDLMTNYCTSISIVQYMASGVSPQDACLGLLRHMVNTDPRIKTEIVV